MNRRSFLRFASLAPVAAPFAAKAAFDAAAPAAIAPLNFGVLRASSLSFGMNTDWFKLLNRSFDQSTQLEKDARTFERGFSTLTNQVDTTVNTISNLDSVIKRVVDKATDAIVGGTAKLVDLTTPESQEKEVGVES